MAQFHDDWTVRFGGLGLNREPQIIECRITNYEGWNRFAKSIIKQTEYIHSTFDVERSMFISFFYDQTGRFFWPAAGLTPETSNLYPESQNLTPDSCLLTPVIRSPVFNPLYPAAIFHIFDRG
mgnify:FL=1|jgi:hypothetical protein